MEEFNREGEDEGAGEAEEIYHTPEEDLTKQDAKAAVPNEGLLCMHT